MSYELVHRICALSWIRSTAGRTAGCFSCYTSCKWHHSNNTAMNLWENWLLQSPGYKTIPVYPNQVNST